MIVENCGKNNKQKTKKSWIICFIIIVVNEWIWYNPNWMLSHGWSKKKKRNYARRESNPHQVLINLLRLGSTNSTTKILTLLGNLYQRLVSIQRPFGYEPNEIPLLYVDLFSICLLKDWTLSRLSKLCFKGKN